MKNIVLISCVKAKRDYETEAVNLYISPYFKYNYKYALMLKPDAIYILSAKYGLTALNQKIKPYELTLNNFKVHEIREWANIVNKDIADEFDVDNTNFTFLAGNNYRRFLIPEMKHYEVPFKGLGIGYQLGELKKLTSINI